MPQSEAITLTGLEFLFTVVICEWTTVIYLSINVFKVLWQQARHKTESRAYIPWSSFEKSPSHWSLHSPLITVLYCSFRCVETRAQFVYQFEKQGVEYTWNCQSKYPCLWLWRSMFWWPTIVVVCFHIWQLHITPPAVSNLWANRNRMLYLDWQIGVHHGGIIEMHITCGIIAHVLYIWRLV